MFNEQGFVKGIRSRIQLIQEEANELRDDINRLNLMIEEYYAEHWDDADNPEVEFEMRRSFAVV